MGGSCSTDSAAPTAASGSSAAAPGSPYKLTYFNLRGRAETIRLCLAAGDIPYKDNRIEKSDWPGLKTGTPWGTVPVLEVNGKKYGQSMAIARFIAREAGMGGKDSFEQALIDSVTDQITDLREKAGAAFFKPDDEKEAALSELKEKTIPSVLESLERFAEDHKERPGCFVGNKISLADIHFYATMELVLGVLPNALSKYPTLQTIFEAVESNQRIAEYVKKRPKTDM